MKKLITLLLIPILLLSCTKPKNGGEHGTAEERYSESLSASSDTDKTAAFNSGTAEEGETETETETETESAPETETASETESASETVAETEVKCTAKLTSAVIPAAGNYGIGADIIGEIGENEVTFKASLISSPSALSSVTVNLTADGGSASLSHTDKSGKTNLARGAVITISDPDGGKRYYTVKTEFISLGIPTVSVDTGNSVIQREEYVDAKITVNTDGVSGKLFSSKLSSLTETNVRIRGRGHSTWKMMPKKPYKLKFEEKVSLLGLKKAKEWTLLANYADMSLMRNTVAYSIARVCDNMDFIPTQYPVNLFVNGEYAGVYSLGEQLEVKSGRVELEENNFTPDTSFLLEIGGTETPESFGITAFNTGCFRFCAVKYPDENEITPEQVKFIENYIAEAEKAVFAKEGYEDYIDVDSMIDWFIVHELTYNLESCFRRSCYFTKEAGGKLKFGPVWDFDLAMGNLYNDFGDYSSWMCLSQKHGYIEKNRFNSLMDDESFRTKLRARWDEIKESLLTALTEAVDEAEKLISPSAEYNFALWQTLGTRSVAPQPLDIVKLDTYEKHVSYIREFLINRYKWMDSNI